MPLQSSCVPEPLAVETPAVMNLPGCLVPFLLAVSCPGLVQAADWPQWRGVARDGRADETLAITALPPDLKPSWRIDIGGGFSSPVIASGKLVYLDGQHEKEVVHVTDPLSGKELWNRPFAEIYGDEWG